jgi:hypothetical protein
VALAVYAGGVLADEPLPPPATHRVSSPSGRFAVVSDPSTGTRVIESASGKQLWQIPGWFRSLNVSDDGQYLAIGYDGLNLVPVGATDTLEIISFWNRGRKVKSVPLRAIAPDRAILQRTVSHLAWGSIGGINRENQLVVTRIDGRVFRFNMANGEAE